MSDMPDPQRAEQKQFTGEEIKSIIVEIGKIFKATALQTTIQMGIVTTGAIGVLALAYMAASQSRWDEAISIVIPVLTFLAGLFAGRSSR
jgi:energy-converting hydrogenase Eha subunit C